MKTRDAIMTCAMAMFITLCGVVPLTIKNGNQNKEIAELKNNVNAIDKELHDPKVADAITAAIVVQFYLDYGTEENTIITVDTIETYNKYYLSKVYYHIDFDNNVYKAEYICAINDKQDLVIREIK